MAVSGTYYLNGPDLASSTAIFSDEDMNICAPNGLYSNGIIVRELLNCLLLPAQTCPSCALPCDNIAGVNNDINGTFLAQISGGAGTGAIVIYSIVGGIIPDGVLTTYNGQTYNQLTYIGNAGGPVGLNTPLGQPTYYGSNVTTPVSATSLPIYTVQTDGSYISNGNSQPITVNANQLDLRGGGSRVYTQVIPKNSASVSAINVDYYAPIQTTFFSFQTGCPIQLDSFLGSSIQADDTCADATINYYFAQNATTTLVSPITFVPETLSTPGVGNYVFIDDGGGTKINDTATSQFVILANSTYIEIQYGIVIATGTCTPATSPGIPCGTQTPPPSSRGSYITEIDTGSTPSDIGAMVIYFDPASVPDGILVTFDGQTYNELSSINFGYMAAPAGLATYVGTPTAANCFPTLVSNSPYTTSPSNDLYTYNPATNAYDLTGSRNYSIANSQVNSLPSAPGYSAMVIPKPTLAVSGNNTMTIDIFAPCATAWGLGMNLSCPGQLSSRQASANLGSGTNCVAASQTIYYNYNYNNRTQPINNIDPEVHNFVFSDQFATTALTPGNYNVNGQIITVANGVITSINSCVGP